MIERDLIFPAYPTCSFRTPFASVMKQIEIQNCAASKSARVIAKSAIHAKIIGDKMTCVWFLTFSLPSD
jgi:hypothetical protein